jgi:septum formation protein
MSSFQLVLASTSIYRRELLLRLQLPFSVVAPDVDEAPLGGETPENTAGRLAELKARAVSELYPDALIIGSDQVAVLEGTHLGKPLTHENALRQLRFMSGKTVVFHTAVCLFNSSTNRVQNDVVASQITFRSLSDTQIERYLSREQPYHCAGSAKTEGLGIALIEQIRGDDPNALIGLPLISLVSMLAKEGVELP